MGDSSMHEIQRRLPPRFHTSANDVYITRKTQIAAQFGRCKSMLDKKSDQIVIHALGLAINRALNLALKLEDAMKGSVRLEIVTSSVGVSHSKPLPSHEVPNGG